MQLGGDFVLDAWLPKVPLWPVATVVGGTDAAGLVWMNLLWLLWASGFAVAAWRLWLAQREIARWRAGSQRVAWVAGVEIRKLAGLRTGTQAFSPT